MLAEGVCSCTSAGKTDLPINPNLAGLCIKPAITTWWAPYPCLFLRTPMFAHCGLFQGCAATLVDDVVSLSRSLHVMFGVELVPDTSNAD
jgi:hypothetical protein